MKKFLMTVALGAAVAFAPTAPADAQSIEELLATFGFTDAQIVQVMAATAQTPTVTTGGSLLSAHNGVNLMVGSRGARVMELQRCMNQAGYNTGIVDGAFGPNTAAGVRSFQASQGLREDGIVGMATTPAFQAACPVMVTAPVTPAEPTEPEEPQFDINEGDEADFSNFELENADDDTIEEGAEEAELAEIEFELEEGGAALLERMDLVLNYQGGGDGEDDAWEVFETIYLMVDGDVIAEMDADDEDDWDDSVAGDETRFRMSGIDHVFDADETHTIVVAADLA